MPSKSVLWPPLPGGAGTNGFYFPLAPLSDPATPRRRKHRRAPPFFVVVEDGGYPCRRRRRGSCTSSGWPGSWRYLTSPSAALRPPRDWLPWVSSSGVSTVPCWWFVVVSVLTMHVTEQTTSCMLREWKNVSHFSVAIAPSRTTPHNPAPLTEWSSGYCASQQSAPK